MKADGQWSHLKGFTAVWICMPTLKSMHVVNADGHWAVITFEGLYSSVASYMNFPKALIAKADGQWLHLNDFFLQCGIVYVFLNDNFVRMQMGSGHI